MSLKRYGVLKGRPIGKRFGSGTSPHYQVHVVDETTDYRIAVNVQSKLSPSELLYLVEDDLRHPITAGLHELPWGFNELAIQPGGGGLDFIRGNLFDRERMRLLPPNAPGADNDLNEKVDAVIERAISDEGALIYAFGERWGPEPATKDKIFGFLPGNGVHDIHMNQGNHPQFQDQDGVWQDGGLLIHLPEEGGPAGRWIGVFLAFQSQAWHTDDVTGHTLEGDQGARGMAIVAALVNPVGPAPERETVTLLNASPQAIDLTGWAIADRNKKRHVLAGTAAAGATLTVALPPTVQLGNQGGIITLLDAAGLKVDGVAYTRDQARSEGWTVVFRGGG